jgi:hypothetical protein
MDVTLTKEQAMQEHPLIAAYERLNTLIGREEYGLEGSGIAYRVGWDAGDSDQVSLFVLDTRLYNHTIIKDNIKYACGATIYYQRVAYGSEAYIRSVLDVLIKFRIAPEDAPSMGITDVLFRGPAEAEYMAECEQWGFTPILRA